MAVLVVLVLLDNVALKLKGCGQQCSKLAEAPTPCRAAAQWTPPADQNFEVES